MKATVEIYRNDEKVYSKVLEFASEREARLKALLDAMRSGAEMNGARVEYRIDGKESRGNF